MTGWKPLVMGQDLGGFPGSKVRLARLAMLAMLALRRQLHLGLLKNGDGAASWDFLYLIIMGIMGMYTKDMANGHARANMG